MDKYENVEKQLDPKEIKEFEQQLGVDLPQDFVDFYLVNNGGNPPFYYVEGAENVFALDGFLPIKYGSLTIGQLLKDYEKQGITVEDKIPFANDPGGNIFFLSTSPADKNSIYILPAENDPSEEGSYLFVCASFTAFLEGLTNQDEEEE
ncbi:MAG TPA: SMI1/KNR4 family protein [Puia sp.]|nr:SMI1/KNR4 family protein [Puia sp.]